MGLLKGVFGMSVSDFAIVYSVYLKEKEFYKFQKSYFLNIAEMMKVYTSSILRIRASATVLTWQLKIRFVCWEMRKLLSQLMRNIMYWNFLPTILSRLLETI